MISDLLKSLRHQIAQLEAAVATEDTAATSAAKSAIDVLITQLEGAVAH